MKAIHVGLQHTGVLPAHCRPARNDEAMMFVYMLPSYDSLNFTVPLCTVHQFSRHNLAHTFKGLILRAEQTGSARVVRCNFFNHYKTACRVA